MINHPFLGLIPVPEKKAPEPYKFKAKPIPKGLFNKKPNVSLKAAAKPKAAAAAAATEKL